MDKKVKINGYGEVKLDSSNYKASGGQADIFVVNNKAIKIYKDPKNMIPVEKIKELQTIGHDKVLAPQEIVYEKSKAVGYMTDFKDNCVPLCQLFTKSFKNANGITTDQIHNLIEQMQDVVKHVHQKGFLIVDLNEMNVLVDETFSECYFIDTDSYKTPSYKADAIMESIRDPQIKDNKWTENSDWFSFAILSFYLCVGIHPYRGGHPDYKPKEWIKRMADGVSVFDPKAKLPKPFRDFSAIPSSHLTWFEAVFKGNQRLSPPELSQNSQVISSMEFQVDHSDAQFDIGFVFEAENKSILDYYDFMGVPYFNTYNEIFKDNVLMKDFGVISTPSKLIDVGGNMPAVLFLKDNKLHCQDFKGNALIEPIFSRSFFVKDGKAYTSHNGKMTEIAFKRIGNKMFGAISVIAGTMRLATEIHDGFISETIFGDTHFIVPYQKNDKTCASTIKIDELKDSRVVTGKLEDHVCCIYTERNGQYDRLVFTFNKEFTSYEVRVETDVTLGEVSMTVLPNGVTALATESTVEIFKGSSVKVIQNAPFTNANKLFNILGTVHYIDGDKVYKAKMK